MLTTTSVPTTTRSLTFRAARALALILLLSGGLVLVGCDQAGLTGSASMRVEVEVYKGPLSKELTVQRGELIGIIRDASTALSHLKYDTEVSACRLGCSVARGTAVANGDKRGNTNMVCDERHHGFPIPEETTDDAQEDRFRTCPILLNILDDTQELITGICEFSNLDPIGFECNKDDRKRSAQFDELAKGMVEQTLSSEPFVSKIERLLRRRIAGLVDEQRSAIEKRISSEVRRSITETLQPDHAQFLDRYVSEQQRNLSELARIRNDAARERADIEGRFHASMENVEGQRVHEIRAAMSEEIEKVETERDAKLELENAEHEQRLDDIRNAYEILEAEIDTRLQERSGEIVEKVETAVVEEQQVIRDDPNIVEPLVRELRDSLTGEAEDYAKRRLRSDRSAELVNWQKPEENQEKINVYRRAAKIAQQLRSRAEYWATAHTAIAPDSKRVRIEMADFANFTANYGNQIGARADALLKQSDWNGSIGRQGGPELARELLANSVFLRDSQPTSYLKLYDWNSAAVFLEGSGATDRVRMVEQLVQDTYWANVNTVFATGRGTFTTALIKDDIGNWNLKNYDNAPGELLEAYKEAGFAAVKALSDVTRSAIGDGDTEVVGSALEVANRVALGTGTEEADTIRESLDSLTKVTQDRITSIGELYQTLLEEANRDVESATVAENEARVYLETAASEVVAAQKQLEAQQLLVSTTKGALEVASEELIAAVAVRKAKAEEYRTLKEEVVELEKSGANETLLAEKARRRDSTADELVEAQQNEIEKLERVQARTKAVNDAEETETAARSLYEANVEQQANRRADHLKLIAESEAAERNAGAIRLSALTQMQQVVDFHGDMIDLLGKQNAKESAGK